MYEPLEFAIQLAFESGRIQRKHFHKTLSIGYKGEINIVTNVDFECQHRIIELITQHFPDDDIIAEEKANAYGSRKNKWIVDPLDGTTNYAHGYPFFCTSIGYEVAGEVVVGVVYNPIDDELFFARRGDGSFFNGERIRVSTVSNMKQALLSTGFPYDIATNPNNNIRQWTAFLFKAQGLRRDGSAGLNLSYTAAGRFDGFWELKLGPWDMAAGVLIVTEAGGTVTSVTGDPFNLYRGGIAASNGLLHQEMVSVIREGL